MAAQGTVEELLARAEQQEAERLRLITVHKELELQLDLGNLLACDPNPPEACGRRQAPERERRLQALARDNAQLLVNALWALPAERAGDAPLLARLPEPATRLPREKPPPRPRAPTRWEEFARLKGIQKRKKTNLQWDEVAGGWRRRWGYQRARDDTKEWLIEVPEAAADPGADLFGERLRAKRERVAKNELNRLRNLARGQKRGAAPLPGQGLAPGPAASPAQLGRALRVARASTASAGRFQQRLPREKEARGAGGKKRRFEPLLGDLRAERARQLEVLERISGKGPRLDSARAAHMHMRQEDGEAAALRRRQPKKGGRGGGKSKGGPGPKGKGGPRGKAAVGKRRTAGSRGKIPAGKRNKK